MMLPRNEDVRRPRIDEFAKETPYFPAGWRWFAERWQWTDRETEVAQLWVIGQEEKRIARELSISAETVHTHLKSLYDKTNTHKRSEFMDKLAQRCPTCFRNDPKEERTPPELNFCTSPEKGMVIVYFSTSIPSESHADPSVPLGCAICSGSRPLREQRGWP